MNNQHYREKINRPERFFSKESITVTQNSLYFTLQRTLGVKNMDTIEIAYANKDYIKSNIHK